MATRANRCGTAGRWVYTYSPASNGQVLCIIVIDGWRTLRAYTEQGADPYDMLIAMLNKAEIE